MRRDLRDSRRSLEEVAERVTEIEKDMAVILGRAGGDGRIKGLEDMVRLQTREIDKLRMFQWKIIGAASLAGILVGLVATLIAKFL